MSDDSLGTKTLLENSWFNSFSIPILIVLLGAAIIFGVTKILSTERTYKDLVLELNSKSFGNKWISAYELSKVINSSQIKKEDIPWIVENLKTVYFGAADARTKQFVIVALGALRSVNSIDVYMDVLTKVNSNPDVTLQALIALSKLSVLENFDYKVLKPYLNSSETVVKQTLFLLIAKFKIALFEKDLILSLASTNLFLRYTAATALINFKNSSSISTLNEILSLVRSEKNNVFGENQRLNLIYNVLNGLKKMNWKILLKGVGNLADNEPDLKLREVARSLKVQFIN